MTRATLLLFAGASLLATGAAAAGDAPGSLSRSKLSLLPARPVAAGTAAPPPRIPKQEQSPSVHVEMTVPNSYATINASAACVSRDTGWPMDRVLSYVHEAVVNIRVERLMEDKEHPQLTIETVMVDARSGGSKSAGVETIALLTMAATTPNGERVYAFRDDNNVHLLWHSPQSVQWRDARTPTGNANCGHAHLLIDAKDVNGPKSSIQAMSTRSAFEGGKSKVHTFHLAASLSKTSRDGEPVLSVGVTSLDERQIQGLPTVSDIAALE
jgi:hypothetical protein